MPMICSSGLTRPYLGHGPLFIGETALSHSFALSGLSRRHVRLRKLPGGRSSAVTARLLPHHNGENLGRCTLILTDQNSGLSFPIFVSVARTSGAEREARPRSRGRGQRPRLVSGRTRGPSAPRGSSSGSWGGRRSPRGASLPRNHRPSGRYSPNNAYRCTWHKARRSRPCAGPQKIRRIGCRGTPT